MGKSKKRSRASNARANPLLRNAAKDDQLRTKRIQPLIAQLSSVIPNERSMALGSITVLCEDPHMRSLLLKEKLINEITTKLLTDSNTEIIVEAYGVLRNLALEEGYDIATHIWRSNIWVNIESGLSQVEQSLQSMKQDSQKIKKESARLLFDFAENLLSMVVALANGSADIMDDIINSDKLLTLLKVITEILEYGLSISENVVTLTITTQLFNSILDFIFDLSGESSHFVETVSAHPYLSPFVENLLNWEFTNGNELTKVLIQGIYLQFMDIDISYEIAASIITKVLQSVEHIDLSQVKSILSDSTEDAELLKTDDNEVAKKIKEYTKKRSEAMIKLQSIEISIDIITASIELIGAKYEETKKPIDDSLLQILTQSLPLVFSTLYSEFTSRILIGWNNLLWLCISVGIDIFQVSDQWKELWDSLQDVSQDSDFAIRLGKLSVTWALLKNVYTVYGPGNSSGFFEYVHVDNETFIKSVINIFEQTSDLDEEETFELQQRCVGILSALAQFWNHVEMNGMVGDFLIQILSNKDTKAPILVEATNSLFDIYSDINFDYDVPIFVQRGYLQALKTQVQPNLKSVFKFVDKNKNPELKERCQDCLSTLQS